MTKFLVVGADFVEMKGKVLLKRIGIVQPSFGEVLHGTYQSFDIMSRKF